MSSVSTVTKYFRSIRNVLKLYAGQIWIVLLVLFTSIFVIRQQSEVTQFGQALANADLKWVVAAIMAQIGILGLFALTYHGLLQRLGYRISRIRLIDIHLQRHVVGTVTPIGGPASVYVFIRSLGAHGITSNDALLTTALRSLSGYASFVVLFVPIVLLSNPSFPIMVGASIVSILLVAMLGALFLLLRINQIRGWFEMHSPQRASSFIMRVREHDLVMRDLGRPVLLSLAANIAGVATMYLSLIAVGYQASPITVLFAYATGIMMLTIAPVFQGIGIVEVTMVAALQQMGVPATSAVAATLLFRFCDVWLPLGIGLGTQLPRTSVFQQAVKAGRTATLEANPSYLLRMKFPARFAAAAALAIFIPGLILVTPDRILGFLMLG